jgi:hypothetical protein
MQQNQFPKVAKVLMSAAIIVALFYFLCIFLVYLFQDIIALIFTGRDDVISYTWFPTTEIILQSLVYILLVTIIILILKLSYHTAQAKSGSIITIILITSYIFLINYVHIMFMTWIPPKIMRSDLAMEAVMKLSYISTIVKWMEPFFILSRMILAIAVCIAGYELYQDRSGLVPH